MSNQRQILKECSGDDQIFLDDLFAARKYAEKDSEVLLLRGPTEAEVTLVDPSSGAEVRGCTRACSCGMVRIRVCRIIGAF